MSIDFTKPLLSDSPYVDLDGQPVGLDALSEAEALTARVEHGTLQCAAQTASGTACRNAAWPESLYCPWHGGNAKLARSAGKEVRKAIDKSLRLIPDDSVLDPFDLLSRAASRSAKLADVVGDLLATIDPEDWEMDTPQGMAVRPAFKMYQTMLRQTLDAARLLQKAGIEDHRIRLDAAKLALQIRAMKKAFQAGIESLGLSDEQVGTAMTAMLYAFEASVNAAPSVGELERGV